MEETIKLLVLTKEKKNVIPKITSNSFQIRELENCKETLKKLDGELYDSYDYLLFIEKDPNYKYIGHYFPINIDDKNRNQIYINELLYNSIILDNIKYLVDEISALQISVIIRHIIRKDISYKGFKINKEIDYISSFNNYSKFEYKNIKRYIYNGIKKHYCQDSFFRTIKFELNKERIVKKFLFKVYKNIIEDTKRNTKINLVFKELIGIIK